MDEDFQSFIVDPNLVDEGIDVSGLKTQTSTRPELLFDLPEFSGIKVDPTRDRYIQDMYQAYGGGLPMLPEPVVEDTAQIPGAIDTLLNVGGGGGGMDQATSDPVITQPIQDLVDPNVDIAEVGLTGDLTPSGTFGGQPTFTTTPGTSVDPISGDITNPDGGYGGNIVDEVALTGIPPVTTAVAPPSILNPFIETQTSPLAEPGISRLTDDIDIDTLDDTIVTPSIDSGRGGTSASAAARQAAMDTFDTTPSIDFSDLDDLEADPGAQPRDDIDTSLPIDSIVRDTLINTIFDAPVTLVPKAIEAITEKSESQKEYESYTPEQQGAINQAFSATGISGLANKNPVSLFGKGALETAKESLDQRINNVGIDNTTLELNNFVQTLGGESDARIDEAVADAEAKAKAERDAQAAIAEAEAKAKADRDAEVESRRQLEARIDANRRAAAEDYGGGNGGGAGGGQDAGAYGGGAMRGRGDNF
jgi:ribosomal protein L12E/L44/L45/RPP1/RPP2